MESTNRRVRTQTSEVSEDFGSFGMESTKVRNQHMAENWICWLYQYGVGGLVFFGTLTLATWTQALRPANRADRWLLALLVSGFFAFAAIHGFWIAAVV